MRQVTPKPTSSTFVKAKARMALVIFWTCLSRFCFFSPLEKEHTGLGVGVRFPGERWAPSEGQVSGIPGCGLMRVSQATQPHFRSRLGTLSRLPSDSLRGSHSREERYPVPLLRELS